MVGARERSCFVRELDTFCEVSRARLFEGFTDAVDWSSFGEKVAMLGVTSTSSLYGESLVSTPDEAPISAGAMSSCGALDMLACKRRQPSWLAASRSEWAWPSTRALVV